MTTKFHIPVPHLNANDDEKKWAMENIYDPFVIKALNELKVRQGRIDFDQSIIKSWGMYPKVVEYFDQLGLQIRRFAAMWHRSKPNELQEYVHLDAIALGIPLVGRFNIPIQGQSPAVIQWWDSDFNDPAGQWRILSKETFDGAKKKIGYGLTSDRDWSTVPWEFEVENPGACWNRTEVGHRMRYTGGPEARFLITVEITTPSGSLQEEQISWQEIVQRHQALSNLKCF